MLLSGGKLISRESGKRRGWRLRTWIACCVDGGRLDPAVAAAMVEVDECRGQWTFNCFVEDARKHRLESRSAIVMID